jgi:hypothetical protein
VPPAVALLNQSIYEKWYTFADFSQLGFRAAGIKNKSSELLKRAVALVTRAAGFFQRIRAAGFF